MRRASHALTLTLAAPLLGASLAGGCHVVDSNGWNLSQIHDDDGRHRYTGAIEGDVEYFFRHELVPAFVASSVRLQEKDPGAIEDPAGTCLENLIELEEFGDHDPRVAALQVEWFARLAVSDPWKLSRERAVLGLGRAGERLRAGSPTGLPKDASPAGADAVGEALAGLVRAARPVLERGARASASQRLDLAAACDVVSGLLLDVEGARRLLHATSDLAGAVGQQNDAGEPLLRLCEELQRRCVRQGIARALLDPEPRVRAAAVEAAVRCAGASVLDPILAQLERENSPEVVVRVLEMVRRVGLPEGTGPVPDVTPEIAREARLRAIYDLLRWPEGSVRVAAMLTLARVTDSGITSLREEDWQTWWLERRGKREP